MLTKITSEFLSYDSAETAARAIRDKARGIVKIQISGSPAAGTGEAGQTARTESILLPGYWENSFAGFSSSMNMNGVAMGYPAASAVAHLDTKPAGQAQTAGKVPGNGHTAFLSVVCKNSAAHQAEQLMISCGGTGTKIQKG